MPTEVSKYLYRDEDMKRVYTKMKNSIEYAEVSIIIVKLIHKSATHVILCARSAVFYLLNCTFQIFISCFQFATSFFAYQFIPKSGRKKYVLRVWSVCWYMLGTIISLGFRVCYGNGARNTWSVWDKYNSRTHWSTSLLPSPEPPLSWVSEKSYMKD